MLCSRLLVLKKGQAAAVRRWWVFIVEGLACTERVQVSRVLRFIEI